MSKKHYNGLINQLINSQVFSKSKADMAADSLLSRYRIPDPSPIPPDSAISPAHSDQNAGALSSASSPSPGSYMDSQDANKATVVNKTRHIFSRDKVKSGDENEAVKTQQHQQMIRKKSLESVTIDHSNPGCVKDVRRVLFENSDVSSSSCSPQSHKNNQSQAGTPKSDCVTSPPGGAQNLNNDKHTDHRYFVNGQNVESSFGLKTDLIKGQLSGEENKTMQTQREDVRTKVGDLHRSSNPSVKMGMSSLAAKRNSVDENSQSSYVKPHLLSRQEVDKTCEYINSADQSMEVLRNMVENIDARKQQWLKVAFVI